MSPIELIIVLVAVVGGLAIPLLVLLLPAIIILGVIRLLRGPVAKENKEASAEETRIIQELHRGLLKMEERVEALETLVVEDHEERKVSHDT